MIYRTCTGCFAERRPCATRDRIKDLTNGSGITSVKFRCTERRDLFARHEAVWVKTVDHYGGEESSIDWFPGVVVKMLGSRVVVFIAPEAVGEDGFEFEPHASGFCKIPAARIKPRNTQEEIETRLECSPDIAERLQACGLGVEDAPEFGWTDSDPNIPF